MNNDYYDGTSAGGKFELHAKVKWEGVEYYVWADVEYYISDVNAGVVSKAADIDVSNIEVSLYADDGNTVPVKALADYLVREFETYLPAAIRDELLYSRDCRMLKGDLIEWN